jgi:SAM-dependent methyltransferase
MADSGPGSDPIRDFYERWPHPAQPATLDDFRDRRRVPYASTKAFFHHYWPTRPFTTDLDILFAGCGTTQAVEAALWDREPRIVAIDVSQACLDQSIALARRYEIENIEFHRLALEDVGALDRQFDLICCTGVLHHLKDPDQGLQSLRQVLRRDGSMYLMVYGRYGRLGVYMLQSYCRQLGLQPTPTDLSELQAVLQQLPSDHPLVSYAQRRDDFQSLNGLADVLLNPRDRAFTVPELLDWLPRCGMNFQRWFYQAYYLPQCSTLSDAPHLTRLLKLSPDAQYAAMELFRGHLDKHSFICCRDDRPAESWQVSLDDAEWATWIPIPQPTLGAYSVNDRPGTVAKIVCSAHEFPLRELHLTSQHFALLQLMDGKRTLGEIAAASGRADMAEQTRRLFKDLWDFDQIFLRRGQAVDALTAAR